ncbi:MAG TPA: YkvA family protein [Methylomirabilota bacterium]|nr:YkvA family protein [Methylomirabilota bacterium]
MALLRAMPDIGRLLWRLVRDPMLPRAVKVALAAAAVYLLSPIDLIPDFIPIAGYLDDLLVAAVVVDGILNHVDRSLVLRYWPRTEQALDDIGRAARLLAAWLPRRLKRRIFATG